MSNVIQLLPTRDLPGDDLSGYLFKQVELLMQRMQSLETALATQMPNKSVWCNVREGTRRVQLDELLYCRAESNYTQLHFVDGSKLLISNTLKATQTLINDARFMRAHQSFLVNKDKVSIFSGANSEITMQGGIRIPVSRAHHKSVRECLTRP